MMFRHILKCNKKRRESSPDYVTEQESNVEEMHVEIGRSVAAPNWFRNCSVLLVRASFPTFSSFTLIKWHDIFCSRRRRVSTVIFYVSRYYVETHSSKLRISFKC
jgi:hypothetical protein